MIKFKWRNLTTAKVARSESSMVMRWREFLLALFLLVCTGSIARADSAVTVFKDVSKKIFVVRAAERQGSAVWISNEINSEFRPETWFVSNAHVVRGHQFVQLEQRSRTFSARVAFVDELLDFAFLVSDGYSGVQDSKPWIVANTPPVGDRVYAVGAPLGLELSITDGLVSGYRKRNYLTLIQTSAPISPGNSGGGLFDSKGRLVGITTFKLRDGENLNFSLSWAEGKELFESFKISEQILRLYPDLNNPDFVRWMAGLSDRNRTPLWGQISRIVLSAVTANPAERVRLRTELDTLIARYQPPSRTSDDSHNRQHGGRLILSCTYYLDAEMRREAPGPWVFEIDLDRKNVSLGKRTNVPLVVTDTFFKFVLTGQPAFEIFIDRTVGRSSMTNTTNPRLVAPGKCSRLKNKQF
jgi:hypothetical protein